MGRQARLKRERSKARQDQALPVVDEWRDLPAPTGNGATVYVKGMGATFTDTPRSDTQEGIWLPSYASQTTDDSGMYSTVTREPSNSRTDDPVRRADEAAARGRAQEVTVFPADPRRAQVEAKMAAALAFFVGSGLDLRNPPQRRSIPRPPDGRFTPKRPS